jgi:carbon monoxide dehydrogenase subunit G
MILNFFILRRTGASPIPTGKGLILMHIEGTYTLLAPPEHVWYGMQDQQILLRTVPGVRQIEALDKHTFAISLTMNQEPFSGNCQGQFTISEQQFPYHYRVALEGTNNQGQFRGEITIHLQARDDSTVVAYTGTIHLTSSGEPIPANLARGAAKLLIQQFFTALNDLLQTNDALDADFAAVVERYDLYSLAGTVGTKNKKRVALKGDASNPVAVTSFQLPSVKATPEWRGIFPTIVHLLGLGHGEPKQEQIWTRRLRRTSTVAGLVFLVWLGTRLPRRRVEEAL